MKKKGILINIMYIFYIKYTKMTILFAHVKKKQ